MGTQGKTWSAVRAEEGDSMSEFLKRDELIQSLGFPSYYIYLKSELWGRIRRKVFAKKGRRCIMCSLRATQVHHSSYTIENIRGESTNGLHPVCDDCHGLLHLDGDKLVSMQESRSRLRTCQDANRIQLKTKTSTSRSKGRNHVQETGQLCPGCNKHRTMLLADGKCQICEARRLRPPKKKSKKRKANPYRMGRCLQRWPKKGSES